MNRLRNGSPVIYVEANFITFAEINKTTAEKRRPIGSKIMGKYKLEEANEIISQIIIIVIELNLKYKEFRKIKKLME